MPNTVKDPVREKLIELVGQVQDCGCDVTDVVEMRYVENNVLLDHLIANGVTVQEWISVKDRLPEVASKHKDRWGWHSDSVRVLCVCVQKDGKTLVKEGYLRDWGGNRNRWMIPGTIDFVTHWMPLPPPPKGE